MIVFAAKSEIRFKDDLNILQELDTNKIFLYLQFSKLEVPKFELFESFLKIIDEGPDSYMAKIYLFEDKDIMILMEGFMLRHFEEAIQKIQRKFNLNNIDIIKHLFSARNDREKLKELSLQKIVKFQGLEQEKVELKKQVDSDEIVMSIMSGFDHDLLCTIDERRGKRSDNMVMIADDDQLSRTLAGNVLGEGNNLVFAQNGAAALKEYIVNAPDIVFLDIGMPDIGGHQVLECIFQLDPQAYIIMFSGRKDKDTILYSLEKGAQGFVGKPFTRKQLNMHVGNSVHIVNKKQVVA